MKKSKTKNLIKLIAVCAAAIIFSVFAVVFFIQDNVFGWFARIDQSNANGMEVVLHVKESVVSTVEFFTFSEKNDESYTFIKSNITTMETYHSLENNAYQIVIKVKLTEVTDSVLVSAHTSAENYLGADDASYLTASGNSMSSVVAFEIYYSDSDSSKISETTNSNGETTAVTITPPDSPTEYSFVKDDKTLSPSVSFGTHDYESAGNNAVYLVIKYNSSTITEVFGHNIGNEIFDTSQTVDFDKCDFSFTVA